MKLDIAVIQGDGIGPEITKAAICILRDVCQKYQHELLLQFVLASGEAIEACQNPLPAESLNACQNSGAVLFGNTGLSKYKNYPLEKRPEYALMKLRKELKVTTNIRPVYLYPMLEELSPLKTRLLGNGIDIVFTQLSAYKDNCVYPHHFFILIF